MQSPTENNHSSERRPSRDIGTQAYSIDFEKEKPTSQFIEASSSSKHSISTDTREKDFSVPIKRSMIVGHGMS